MRIKCTKCPLHEQANTNCMPGRGLTTSKVVIVGEAPGREEDAAGIPFIWMSGKFLKECLDYAGVSMEDIFITNSVRCRPPDNRTPKTSEINACSEHLSKELMKVKPTYMLLLGASALYAVTGRRQLKKHRGASFKEDDVTYKVTYHPAYGLRNPKAKDVIREDIRQFFMQIKGEKELYVPYRIINGNPEFDLWVDKNRGKFIAMDCETTSLNAFDPNSNIISIGFSNGKEQWIWSSYADNSPPPVDALNAFKLVTHNGKFDAIFIAKKWGIVVYPKGDTQLLYHLKDENSSLELKNILSREFKPFVDYNVSIDVKTMGGTDEHYEYLAKDVYYTYKLWKHARKTIDSGLLHVHDKLSIKVQNYYIDAELNGVYLDRVALSQAVAKATKVYNSILNELKAYADINWNSPQQASKILIGLGLKLNLVTPTGKPSLKEEALLELRNTHPIPDELLTLREVGRELSFLKSWEEAADSSGYIHPNFKITGTVTGRPSCTDPNLQQTPRKPYMRRCFGPPPGYALVAADYSQIELKLVACDAEEPIMLSLFNKGVDIHSATVKDIFNIDNPTKEERVRGKIINFGFIYGMSWQSFIRYAFIGYGVHFSDEESFAIREKFFETYPRLLVWHRRRKREAINRGFVSTWTGRRRHLPLAQASEYCYETGEALRQAVNAPIQGGAAELTLAAAIEIRDLAIDIGNKTIIGVGSIHDQLLMYVKEDALDWAIPAIKAVMEYPALLDTFNAQFDVPLTVDIEVGNWGDAVKWSA